MRISMLLTPICDKNLELAAQVGVAGSTEIKDRVSIGGQVGIIGHLTIGSGAKIGSKSAVFLK